MLKLKRLAAIAMSIAMFAAFFTGCGEDDKSSSAKDSKSSSSAESSEDDGGSSEESSDDGASKTDGDGDISDSDVDISEDSQANSSVDTSTLKMLNFTPPEKGEEIIVMKIKDRGDVKIKLFPEQADKGVENFKGLADKGYYDGLIFHRVIKDFMIQGGDPLGTGMGGESIWGDKFDGGVSNELNHVAGAVAYANSGSTATNGSQFYIVTGTPYDETTLNQFKDQGLVMSDEAMKSYEKIGGAPFLDGSYTVFGQVFDGLDIIFDIQNEKTDEMDKPEKDVVIEKISVEKYDGGDVKFYMSDYN